VPRLEVACNPGLTLISLKNLQNYRIGHVQTDWPSEALACYTTSRFQSADASGTVGEGRRFCVMERALKHKYKVGSSVYFTASNVSRPAASGTYEVVRLLPTEGDDCQYRIKSSTEAFERVAKESQLALS
jgi:hypothetical protein